MLPRRVVRVLVIPPIHVVMRRHAHTCSPYDMRRHRRTRIELLMRKDFRAPLIYRHNGMRVFQSERINVLFARRR